MPAKSRRIASRKTKIISRTGVTLETCYCRKCMKFKKPTDFFEAVDVFLDANGKLSICKECCNNIYNRIYINEHSLEKALLRTCRTLNIRYDERAVEAARNHLNTIASKGKDTENTFGIYKMKLVSVQKGTIGDRDTGEDLTFVEPSTMVLENIEATAFDDMEYFHENWGGANFFTLEDYQFLEQEYDKWAETTNLNTQSEKILVKEICIKQNEIRRARIEGKATDNLVKALQEIMKNSALTPALQNAASGGKNVEAFGVWIRDIEALTPAEWYEQQEKFHDMDGIEEDKADIKRSIGNFITGSRDFNTGDLEEVNDLDDDSGLDLPIDEV